MLRKKFSAFVLSIMFVSVTVILTSAYAGPTDKAQFTVGRKGYKVNDQFRTMDAVAFTENGRIYVPARFLGYAIGLGDKGIEWDAAKKRVLLYDDNAGVRLVVGNKVLKAARNRYELTNEAVQGAADDRVIQMDVAPVVRNSRVYLPARWVAEAFGYEVGWDAATGTVLVGPPGQLPAPEPKPAVTNGTDNVRYGSLEKMPILTEADLDAMGLAKPPNYPKAAVMGFKKDSKVVTLWNYEPPNGGPWDIPYNVPDRYDNPAYKKKWIQVLEDCPVIYGKKGAEEYYIFKAVPIMVAMGVPRQSIRWDPGNQVLTVRGNMFREEAGLEPIRYVQIQANNSKIKYVYYNGVARYGVPDNPADKFILKDGKIVDKGGAGINCVIEAALGGNGWFGGGLYAPEPATDNLFTFRL